MPKDAKSLYQSLGYRGDLNKTGKLSGRRRAAATTSAAELPLLDEKGIQELQKKFEKNPDEIVANMRRFLDPDITQPDVAEAIRQAAAALADPEAAARRMQRRGLFGRTRLPAEFQFPGMNLGRIPIDPDDNKFETKGDALAWIIMCGPQFLTAKVGATDPAAFRFHDDPAFAQNGSVFTYSSRAALPVKVALFSDFGTGRYHSRYIADQIVNGDYPYAFHLGDVYYAGRESEFRDFFRGPLDPMLRGTNLFTLAGNHEMYSDAVPYFSYIDERRRKFPATQEQEGSYFCVEFDGFRIVGIDTAYFDGGRHNKPKLLTWLRGVLTRRNGVKNILLSSDHPFDYGKRGTTALLSDLREFVDAGLVDLWFWGNTHYCALFGQSNELPFLGSCIGHGGYPYTTKRAGLVSPAPVSFLETFSRFPQWSNLRLDRGNNGELRSQRPDRDSGGPHRCQPAGTSDSGRCGSADRDGPSVGRRRDRSHPGWLQIPD